MLCFVALFTELWVQIFRFAVGKHGLHTYTQLRLVCRRFRDIIDSSLVPRPIPIPQIYIDPQHAWIMGIDCGAISTEILYETILNCCGSGSGLVRRLDPVLVGLDPAVTLLKLSHIMFGWFKVENIRNLSPYEASLFSECF